MPPVPSPTTADAPAAATSSATSLRRSARASACAPVRSQRAHPSARVHADHFIRAQSSLRRFLRRGNFSAALGLYLYDDAPVTFWSPPAAPPEVYYDWNATRRFWPKRIFSLVAGLFRSPLLLVVAVRMIVRKCSRRRHRIILAHRFTPAPSWDTPDYVGRPTDASKIPQLTPTFPWESSVARTADLRTRSSSFDRSVATLQQIVSAHQGYLEELRTETRSGSGRAARRNSFRAH